MKRVILLIRSAVCMAILVTVILSSSAARGWDQHPTPTPGPSPTAYDPYPPGILPSDLDSEIARVRGEVEFVAVTTT